MRAFSAVATNELAITRILTRRTANAIDYQGIVGQIESKLLGDSSYALLDDRIVELLHPTCFDADDMVVVTLGDQFKHRLTTLELVTSDDICRFKLRQNAIDSCQADFLTPRQKFFVNILGTHVPVRVAFKNLKDFYARKSDL